ncbi:MAG TPA: hypothetical protein VGR22_10860, partial [Thermomicrobiales bacterium]|nr:hypothetical protein [Thermomicrobiales bacterium]
MLEIGNRYRRRDLHRHYGGQWQGGISTPSAHPLVFLFTGETGEQYGYRDGWEPDGTFRYTGEGQLGDMAFVRGNAAIRDHAAEGKDLHLFEVSGRGFVRYVGQMVCAGYDIVPGIPDWEGSLRAAIVFRLVEADAVASAGQEEDAAVPGTTSTDASGSLWTRPLDEVRALALRPPPAS